MGWEGRAEGEEEEEEEEVSGSCDVVEKQIEPQPRRLHRRRRVTARLFSDSQLFKQGSSVNYGAKARTLAVNKYVVGSWRFKVARAAVRFASTSARSNL